MGYPVRSQSQSKPEFSTKITFSENGRSKDRLVINDLTTNDTRGDACAAFTVFHFVSLLYKNLP